MLGVVISRQMFDGKNMVPKEFQAIWYLDRKSLLLVREPNKAEADIPFSIHEVTEVWANHLELDFIREHVTGVPTHDGPTVMWYGDDAKFIVRFWLGNSPSINLR